VHRVRAQYEKIRAGRFERRRRGSEDPAGLVPQSGVLQPFDVVEIDAVEDDARRVQAAEPLFHSSLICR
jgi:hypothetical protein